MRGAAYLGAAGAVCFLALAAYVGAAGMELAEQPKTVTAEYVSVCERFDAEGTVLREEEYIVCGGHPRLLVSDGERVPCGALLAEGFRRELRAPKAGFFTGNVGENAPENAVGKIVYGLSWHYEATLQDADGDKLELGDRVTLCTPYGDFEAAVSEKSGGLVRFTAKRGIERLLCADTMPAQVLCGEKSGYRVPASALGHGEDGDFVTVRTGELERRAAVRVTGKSENDLLVEGELRPGMELVLHP